MIIEVKIKNIITIHTDTNDRLDQPFIEVTLECNQEGSTEIKELKFTEMLSNIADLTTAELQEIVQNIISDYVSTAYKGHSACDEQTGDWVKQSEYIGKEFTVTI